MDMVQVREWLKEAVESHGAEVTGAAISLAEEWADVDIKLDGREFVVSSKPMNP